MTCSTANRCQRILPVLPGVRQWRRGTAHIKQQDTFVAPHKLTLGDWLETWLQQYKRPGISPKVVQTMLGHSSISVTLDVYSHVSLELAKQAAAKLNAALTGGT